MLEYSAIVLDLQLVMQMHLKLHMPKEQVFW